MKSNNKLLLLLVLMGSVILTSCKDDEVVEENPAEGMSDLTLNFTGLEDLGANAMYEGWIMVDGAPVSTGLFSIDSKGMMSKSKFSIASATLAKATAFILTIEPTPDPDAAPSAVHVLAGDFSSNNASLVISHTAALNNDFSTAKGKYILATPTDDDSLNEASGIWFLDNSSGMPATGLMLPALPSGWAYEGWAVINGTPVSTGTFTAADMADGSAMFSGSKAGPLFPGEDFLTKAPSGLTFPTDLKGGTAVISIEPVPDNSPMPFALKPLVGMIDKMAMDHTPYDLGQNLSFPTGTASR